MQRLFSSDRPVFPVWRGLFVSSGTYSRRNKIALISLKYVILWE